MAKATGRKTAATEKVAAVKPPDRRAKVPTRATENITKTVEKKVPPSKAPTAGGGEVGGQGAEPLHQAHIGIGEQVMKIGQPEGHPNPPRQRSLRLLIS